LLSEKPDDRYLAPHEVKAALEGLSKADHARLQKAAAALTLMTRIEPQDVLQEAFARTLSGERQCPRNLPIVSLLIGVMRSIRSDWVKAAARRRTDISVESEGQNEVIAIADPDNDPETALSVKQMRDRLVALFEDDIEAQTIIEADLEGGPNGEELRELVGLSSTAFNSKRRLIRRRIEKAFHKEFKR